MQRKVRVNEDEMENTGRAMGMSWSVVGGRGMTMGHRGCVGWFVDVGLKMGSVGHGIYRGGEVVEWLQQDGDKEAVGWPMTNAPR